MVTLTELRQIVGFTGYWAGSNIGTGEKYVYDERENPLTELIPFSVLEVHPDGVRAPVLYMLDPSDHDEAAFMPATYFGGYIGMYPTGGTPREEMINSILDCLNEKEKTK
jgi:hypothetical protein